MARTMGKNAAKDILKAVLVDTVDATPEKAPVEEEIDEEPRHQGGVDVEAGEIPTSNELQDLMADVVIQLAQDVDEEEEELE